MAVAHRLGELLLPTLKVKSLAVIVPCVPARSTIRPLMPRGVAGDGREGRRAAAGQVGRLVRGDGVVIAEAGQVVVGDVPAGRTLVEQLSADDGGWGGIQLERPDVDPAAGYARVRIAALVVQRHGAHAGHCAGSPALIAGLPGSKA